MRALFAAGRISELDQLDNLLATAGQQPTAIAISAVYGTAGVGKTALAVHWARRVADKFPDGQLYINLRGFDPSGAVMAPADAVRAFLDSLGVTPDRIPPDLDAQTALYRSLLNDKRVLIILDNARDTEQIRPLLPGSPSCLLVVTSRNALDGLIAREGARPVPLDLLSDADVRQLLEYRVGPDRVAAAPEAVARIVTACARLPLALAIVAALPAGNVRPLLAELVSAHLLTEHVPGRYTFHDLLRAYAAELAHTVDPADEWQAASRRLLDHYVHSAYAADRTLQPHRDRITLTPPQAGVTPERHGDYDQAMEWFASERPVLLAALGLSVTAGFDDHAWQLPWTLHTFLARQGHRRDRVAVAEVALDATLRLGDRPAERWVGTTPSSAGTTWRSAAVRKPFG